MAHVIEYTELGGPEVLQFIERELSQVPPGHVWIEVHAAGVNPIDWKLRSGLRASAPLDGPRGTGDDGAGVILGVGAGVEGFRCGDAVAFCNANGSYASELHIDAENVFPRPASVTPAQGAAVGIPAGTAYQVLRSLAVSAQDTVLVHGGSGSVGQALIQFAVALGASVVATTSDARAHVVSGLGAVPIGYGDGLIERARAASAHAYTVAIDCAGTDEALEASLALVADRSRIGTIVRGADADALGIRAWRGGSPHPLTPREQAWRLEAMPVTLAMIASGTYRIEFGASYPLIDASRAQAASQAGAPGKLIVTP